MSTSTWKRRGAGAVAGAAVFVLVGLVVRTWLEHESAGPDVDMPIEVAPSVATPAKDLDRAAGAKAAGRSVIAQSAGADSQSSWSSTAPPGEGAVLLVRIGDPPAGSHWNVSVDLVEENYRGATRRRTASSDGRDAVRFERVPIGPAVEVLAMETRGRHMPRRVRVEPALYACEEREVVLIEPAEPALVFRVIGPDGRPFADAWIGAHVARASSDFVPEDFHALKSDADGRVRFVLPAPEGPAPERVLLVHARGSSGRTPDAAEADHLAGQTPVTCEMPRRDTHLGDVFLRPEPVLASGIVVLPDGLDRYGGVDVTAALVGRTPDDSTELECLVFPDGRFEVRGLVTSGLLGLEAQADPMRGRDDFVSDGVVHVPVGARDVRLSMSRGGSIAGTIVASEDQVSVLQVVCRSDAGDVVPSRSSRAGTFRFERLRAGRYHVDVLASGETLEPIVTVAGVLVTAGAATSDPRLQPIDVRALVRRVRVLPVDEQGERVLEGGFRVLRGDRVVQAGEFGWSRIDVLVGKDAFDLEIDVPGFDTLRVADPQDNQKVVLRRGRLLRLKLPSRDLLDTLQDLCVHVRLVPAEGAGSGLRASLDQGGETSFTNVAAGSWRVELELAADTHASAARVPIPLAREQLIRIDARPAIEVRLAVTEDEIAVARAKLPR